mmetsp:Transcript_71314/g.190074  ORF Transcript_71314/g.190074 Transcript_71314/m.190074 type:complete len:316 (+) Transcript_71314:741-1688(+)
MYVKGSVGTGNTWRSLTCFVIGGTRSGIYSGKNPCSHQARMCSVVNGPCSDSFGSKYIQRGTLCNGVSGDVVVSASASATASTGAGSGVAGFGGFSSSGKCDLGGGARKGCSTVAPFSAVLCELLESRFCGRGGATSSCALFACSCRARCRLACSSSRRSWSHSGSWCVSPSILDGRAELEEASSPCVSGSLRLLCEKEGVSDRETTAGTAGAGRCTGLAASNRISKVLLLCSATARHRSSGPGTKCLALHWDSACGLYIRFVTSVSGAKGTAGASSANTIRRPRTPSVRCEPCAHAESPASRTNPTDPKVNNAS